MNGIEIMKPTIQRSSSRYLINQLTNKYKRVAALSRGFFCFCRNGSLSQEIGRASRKLLSRSKFDESLT